jgi:hypothetical protein
MRIDEDYPEVIGNRSGKCECGKSYGPPSRFGTVDTGQRKPLGPCTHRIFRRLALCKEMAADLQ